MQGKETSEEGLFTAMCSAKYREKLTEMVNSQQATVFSTTYCPYCTKAKKVLDRNNIPFKEVMLDEIYGEDQVEVANCVYGQGRRFVPYIYLNQKRLGGFGELHNLDQSGALSQQQ